MINTSLAIPQGIANLIMNVHEGVDQIPSMIGSDVRKRGAVTDFGTGVKEGAKGVWYGWWDGITGLATEPMHGAQKEVSFLSRSQRLGSRSSGRSGIHQRHGS